MSEPPVDPAAFRTAMSRWPTGVSVVTSHHDGQDAGLTVNAFLSVTLRPPLLLVSLTHDADTTPRIAASKRFAVNLLAFDQRPVSDRFAEAIPTERKFAGIGLLRGLGNVPLIDGAIGHLECRVRSIAEAEDHRLVLGEVERIGALRDVPPLLFYRSRYVTPEPDGRASLPNVSP